MDIDKIIASIINVLAKAGASKWAIKDKGALLAAVRLALLPEKEAKEVT